MFRKGSKNVLQSHYSKSMNKSSILRIVCKWTAFKNVHYPPSPHLRSHRNVVNDVIKCVKQQLKFPPHNLKMIPTGLCFIKDVKNPLHFRWTQFTVLISFYISRKIPAICLQLLSLYITSQTVGILQNKVTCLSFCLYVLPRNQIFF